MLLTTDEIAQLTGYARPTNQIDWLRSRKWRFEIGGDCQPKVLRAYAEQQLGLQADRQTRRPRVRLADHGPTAQA